MAEHGFEAATLARVVDEAGIPMSSVYHYFGSKDGILLAVMERGADRFFADLPDLTRRPGRPAQHLARVVSAAVGTLQRHPDFLRLLIVFAAQPPAAGQGRATGCRPPGTRARARSPAGHRSRPRSATIRAARSPASSRASRSPPSTARSWPARPTAGPRSSRCSSRSHPHSWHPAAPCWPEAEQASGTFASGRRGCGAVARAGHITVARVPSSEGDCYGWHRRSSREPEPPGSQMAEPGRRSADCRRRPADQPAARRGFRRAGPAGRDRPPGARQHPPGSS